jgi:antitoxin (DNA-binding transcriptional repressor) of toxin-antitoxin stability system
LLKSKKYNYSQAMAIYNITEAQALFPKLIKDVLAGKMVLIGNQDGPRVKLSVYKPNKRHLGLYDNQGWIAEDFNAPLEDFNRAKR